MASASLVFGAVADNASGGSFAWASTNNIFASDNAYATADFAGQPAGTECHFLRLTNGDDSTIPLNATIDGFELSVEGKRSVSGTSCSVKAALTQGGARIGATSTTWSPTTSDAVRLFPSTGGSTAHWSVSGNLYRSRFHDPTFGADIWAQNGGTWVGIVQLDEAHGTVYYTERTPQNIAATAQPHRILVTWDLISDWNTANSGLQAGSGDEETERWRYEVAVSTDNFSTTLESHIVPSMMDSDGRVDQYADFTAGYEPADTEQFRFPCSAADDDGGTTVFYFRVRLVHIDNTGAIDESGPWSATASASYDATNESAVLAEALNPAPCPDISGIRLSIGFLIGGSLGTGGASPEEKLGINTAFSTGSSIPQYCADLMAALEADLLAPLVEAGQVMFWIRALNGVNAASTDAAHWTTYLNLQGGRLDPTYWATSWAAQGGGSSPGMLTPVDAWVHGQGLTPGTIQDCILSTVSDLDVFSAVASPLAVYTAPLAQGHTGRDGFGILERTGLVAFVNRGIIPMWDVAATEPLYDPEYGAGTVENPSLLLATALDAIGYEYAFETCFSGKSEWAAAGATHNVHDIQAFDLYFDDAAYSGDKVIGTPLDITQYVKASTPAKHPILPPPRPGMRFWIRISNNTCAVVAGTSLEQWQAFLDVAKDLWTAYGAVVIPQFENQTQMDDLLGDTDAAAALASYRAHIADVQRAGNRTPRVQRTARLNRPGYDLA